VGGRGHVCCWGLKKKKREWGAPDKRAGRRLGQKGGGVVSSGGVGHQGTVYEKTGRGSQHFYKSQGKGGKNLLGRTGLLRIGEPLTAAGKEKIGGEGTGKMFK